MLRTTITDTDAKSGQPIPVPETLRQGVQRASNLLESDLLPLDRIDANANWQFVKRSDDRLEVLLDLTRDYKGRTVGYVGYPFDPDSFVDDVHIRRALNAMTLNFLRIQDHINQMEMKRIREGLEQLVPLSG